jgi:hypothetical protein
MPTKYLLWGGRGLHNKQKVDMHYFPPFHKPKLFNLLEQTISKKGKVDGMTIPFS